MTYPNYGLFTPQGQSTPFSDSALGNYTKGYKINPHAPKMTGNKPKYARKLPFLSLK
jgi:hypothetical protein